MNHDSERLTLRYRAKRERGECAACSAPAVPDRTLCEKHRERAAEHDRERRRR